MARVTVEDCVLKVPNRFDLVMLAGQRARDISSGAQLMVDRDDDKNPVVALREIAEDAVNLESLKNALVQGLQHHVEVDEPEEEEIDSLAGHQLLAEAGGEVVNDSEDMGEEDFPSTDEDEPEPDDIGEI